MSLYLEVLSSTYSKAELYELKNIVSTIMKNHPIQAQCILFGHKYVNF